MRHQVYLGLGTNVGNRQHNLQQAVAGLQPVLAVTAVSPIYETEPWGVTDQAPFYNACLGGHTSLTPPDLLTFIKDLEKTMGRSPAKKWGPRLIDVDILLFGDEVLSLPGLTVPHPYLQERAFVLVPLAAIAADVVHPVLGQTMGALATAVDDSTVRRLAEPLLLPKRRES